MKSTFGIFGILSWPKEACLWKSCTNQSNSPSDSRTAMVYELYDVDADGWNTPFWRSFYWIILYFYRKHFKAGFWLVGMILRGVNIMIRSCDESWNVNKAIWENEFYYLFGFLFLVFIILIVACSQISIVMTYFQVYLNKEKNWLKVKTCGILASFLSDHTMKCYFSYVQKTILGGGDVSLSLVVVHSMCSLIRFSISLQN